MLCKKMSIFFSVLPFLAGGLVQCMETGSEVDNSGVSIIWGNKSNPIKAEIYQSIKEATKQHVKDSSESNESSRIVVDSPFITADWITQQLIAAQKNGVEVSAVVGSGARATYEQLKKGNVNAIYNSQTHEKMVAIETPHLKKAVIGSENISNTGEISGEQIAITDTDPETVSAILDAHDLFASQPEPLSMRSPLKVTPQQKRVVNSYQTDLNDSKILRIRHFAHLAQQGDLLNLATMSFNSKKIAQALVSCKNAIERGATVDLFVDSSAVNQKESNASRDMLAQIKQAGVNVYVYNANRLEKAGRFTKYLHAKVMTRSLDDKGLLVVSTANCTTQGNKENNIEYYLPQSLTHVKEVNAWFSQLKLKCEPLREKNPIVAAPKKSQETAKKKHEKKSKEGSNKQSFNLKRSIAVLKQFESPQKTYSDSPDLKRTMVTRSQVSKLYEL